jgi:hypothetical protein
MRKTIFTAGLLVATTAVVLLSPLTDHVFGDAGEPPRSGTPIIIDLVNNGFNLTNPVTGVNFDINADGVADRVAWTAAGSDDGFLALDRNYNGKIDDSRELFGNVTIQEPSGFPPDGWNALALYDGNDDGVINASDSIFPDLRVWIDMNHNGSSDSNELKTLASLSILSIHLSHQTDVWTDQWGNEYRKRSIVTRSVGAARTAYDIYLLYVAGN